MCPFVHINATVLATGVAASAKIALPARIDTPPPKRPMVIGVAPQAGLRIGFIVPATSGMHLIRDVPELQISPATDQPLCIVLIIAAVGYLGLFAIPFVTRAAIGIAFRAPLGCGRLAILSRTLPRRSPMNG